MITISPVFALLWAMLLWSVTAQEPAREIQLLRGDSDTQGGRVSLQIGWQGAARESGLTHYRLYQMAIINGARVKSSSVMIDSVQRKPYVMPSVSGPSASSISVRYFAAGLGSDSDYYRISRSGGYQYGELAEITINGPGRLQFRYMDVEAGDTISVGDNAHSGYSLPNAVEIGEGQHTLMWSTDFTGSTNHDGFIANWEPTNIYSADVIVNGWAGPFLSVVSTYVLPTGTAVEADIAGSPYLDQVIDVGGGEPGTIVSTFAPPGSPGNVGSGGSVPSDIKFADLNMDRGHIGGQLKMFGSEMAVTFRAWLCRKSGDNIHQILNLGEAPANMFKQGSLPIDLVIPADDLNLIASGVWSLAMQVYEMNAQGWSEHFLLRPITDVFGLPASHGSFGGDLDHQASEIHGEVSLVIPKTATSMHGYRAYWATDVQQSVVFGGEKVAANLDFDIVCPPVATNREFMTRFGNIYCDNPFAPKCDGQSCDKITIFQQDDGFYITRAWSTLGGNYTNDELADIYFPYNGTLQSVKMDVIPGDSLKSKWRQDVYDWASAPVGMAPMRIDVQDGNWRYLSWTSDSDKTATGWTIVYRPDFPKLVIPENSILPQGATGVKVKSVYNSPPSYGGGTESQEFEFVKTIDYIRMNATCTPTSMRCPIPPRWQLHNYTTDSNTPTPKVGSCAQQRLQGGQSWFFFEKMSCGSTRSFDSGRGIITDFVELKVLQSDVDQLIEAWRHLDPMAGYFWEEDLMKAPIDLPPNLECACESPMSATADLDTQFEAITEPPVTTAPPENLNTGDSAIVAELKLFYDPSYTVQATGMSTMPGSVNRFYLQANTQFQGNHISISTCVAARAPQDLLTLNILKPLENYCAVAVFDIQEHPLPSGTNNVHRISLRKFRFSGVDSMALQCQIEVCQQQPCGFCQQPRILQRSTEIFKERFMAIDTVMRQAPQSPVRDVMARQLQNNNMFGQHSTNALSINFPQGDDSAAIEIDFSTGMANIITNAPLNPSATQASGLPLGTQSPGGGWSLATTVNPQFSSTSTTSTTVSTTMTETTTSYAPPPVGGGRAGIRMITEAPVGNFTGDNKVGIMSVGKASTTNPPTSTLPPGGVWQPPQIPSLGGDKELVSPYTYAPIVIEGSMSFKTLSPDWALTNRKAIEGTIQATLGLSAYEEVKVTRIMSLTMNQGGAMGFGLGGSGAGGSSFGSSRDDSLTSGNMPGALPAGRRGLFEFFVAAPEGESAVNGIAYLRTPMLRGTLNRRRRRMPSLPKMLLEQQDTTKDIRKDKRLRKLSDEPGVHIDFVIGIRASNREGMMTGNMERMGQGDLALTSAFLMTLDQQLVMQGQPRENLQTNDVGFSPPRVKTINDPTTTPPPTTTTEPETETTTTTRPPSSLMGALGALAGADTKGLLSNPFVLGGAGLLFLLIAYVLVNKLRFSARDTGSYGSSTTASDRHKGAFGDLTLKNYRSQSEPYNRKIDDSSWPVSDYNSRSRGRSRDSRKSKKNRRRKVSSSESDSSRSSSPASSSSGGSDSS